jgi:hypothetical protein
MKKDLFGEVRVVEDTPLPEKLCSIEGCDNRHYGRGWRRKHYCRWQKYGDSLYLSPIYLYYGEPERWFNEHINDETDECIIWPFDKNAAGYGVLKRRGVSSLVCEIKYGPRPGTGREYDACHGPCKNKSCINYRHLSWGTKRQNQLDRHRDGKPWNSAGANNPSAKLTDEKVLQIRDMYHRQGISEWKIARQFGISERNVQMIIDGLTWQHLLPEPTGPNLFS